MDISTGTDELDRSCAPFEKVGHVAEPWFILCIQLNCLSKKLNHEGIYQ